MTRRPPQFISPLSNNVDRGQDWPTRLRIHDGLVNNRGNVVIHETAVACPKCRAKDARDIIGKIATCDLCEGEGWMYVKPRYIMGLITGISSSRILQDFGFALPGDCLMSTSPYLSPGVFDFDRITFLNLVPIDDGEVIIRGVWHERAPDFYTEDEDKVTYEGEDLIYCIDEKKKEYFLGTDFVFNRKKIVWLSANRPLIRDRYTVKYRARVEWIVFQPPTVRFEAEKDFGGRVLLRKRHVAFMQHDKAHQPPALLKAELNFGGEMQV